MSLEDFDRFFTSMKETKITKRIFAVFVAFIVILLISCGDLQVFANNLNDYVLPMMGGLQPTAAQIRSGALKFAGSSSSTLKGIYAWQNSNNSSRIAVVGTYSSSNYLCFAMNWVPGSNTVGYSYVYASGDPYTQWIYPSSLKAYHGYYYVLYTSNTGSYDLFYNHYDSSAAFLDECDLFFGYATPTPEPTPTPIPTPTPEPTFNPDQPTYTTFFNHLLNDGNNALNALYLSWTQANNKFYTGIFFIGLPIMIGIFGIVASIFFGGDD